MRLPSNSPPPTALLDSGLIRSIPVAAGGQIGGAAPSSPAVEVQISSEARAAADGALAAMEARTGAKLDPAKAAMVYADFANRAAGGASTAPAGAPIHGDDAFAPTMGTPTQPEISTTPT